MKLFGTRVHNAVIVIAASAVMAVASTGIAQAGASPFSYGVEGDPAASWRTEHDGDGNGRLDTNAGLALAGLAGAALSSQQVAKRDVFAKQTGRSVAALSGPWHLVNIHSEKCLTVSGASTANNAGAVQYTCDFLSPHNEDWYLEDVYGSGDYWHIINAHSGKCLTVSGASLANNAGAVQYTCDLSFPYNEEWVLENVSGPRASWHVSNAHSGKCLTVFGASLANNAGAVQYTCDYSLPYNEEWAIRY